MTTMRIVLLLIALTGVGYTFASPGYKVYRRINLEASPRVYAVPAYKLGYKFNKDNLFGSNTEGIPYDASFIKELLKRPPIEAFGQPGRTLVQVQPQLMKRVKDDPILSIIPPQFPSTISDPFLDQQLQEQLQQQLQQQQLQQQSQQQQLQQQQLQQQHLQQQQVQQQQLQQQKLQSQLQQQQTQQKSASTAPEQFDSAAARDYLYNYPQKYKSNDNSNSNEDEYTITISVKSNTGSSEVLPAFEMKTNSLPVKIEEIENTLTKLADTFLNQYNLKNGENGGYDGYEKSGSDTKVEYDSYGVPLTEKQLSSGISQAESLSQDPFDYNSNTYNQLSYTNNKNYYDYLNELYKTNGK